MSVKTYAPKPGPEDMSGPRAMYRTAMQAAPSYSAPAASAPRLRRPVPHRNTAARTKFEPFFTLTSGEFLS